MNRNLYISAIICLSSFVIAAHAEAGDWLVRERIINFDPQTKNITENNQPLVNIDRASEPELDVSYFFNKNIATEFSFTMLRPNTTLATDGSNLGDVWIVPPTLTLQYHFFADQPIFRPYVGAGINYTYISTSSSSNGRSVHYYESEVNPAFQIGTDLMITKSWLLNFDVKKLYLSQDIKIDNGPKLRDDIYPWIFGVGIGYKF